MRPFFTLAIALSFCCMPVAAEPTTRPADVQKLLDEMKQAYSKVNSLKLTGTISREFDVAGEVTNEEAAIEATFLAPDRFRHAAQGDATVGSDGKQSFFHIETMNRYLLSPFDGKSLMETISPETRSVLLGQNPSLLMALSKDENLLLMEDGKNPMLAPNEKVDNVDCQVLTFNFNKTAVKLYIDSATRLIRMREVNVLGAIPKEIPNAKKAIVRIRYQTTEVNPTLTNEQFAWTPPAGAREAKPDDSAIAGEPSELEGQPAPMFKLKDLEGGEVSLDAHKGSVVVLDFWATWCGPCRASLPELAKLDEALSPKGLKTFAINIEEEPAPIKQFLSDKNLKLNVLLDTDSKVARSYKVTGIPQTVIIGKDGNIRKVIVGFGGDSAPLRQAIEAALAE